MENIKEVIEKIRKRTETKKIIKEKFNFNIPDYILDEIIYKEYTDIDKQNVYGLIKLAILNKRITKKQGEIIKKKLLIK